MTDYSIDADFKSRHRQHNTRRQIKCQYPHIKFIQLKRVDLTPRLVGVEGQRIYTWYEGGDAFFRKVTEAISSSGGSPSVQRLSTYTLKGNTSLMKGRGIYKIGKGGKRIVVVRKRFSSDDPRCRLRY